MQYCRGGYIKCASKAAESSPANGQWHTYDPTCHMWGGTPPYLGPKLTHVLGIADHVCLLLLLLGTPGSLILGQVGLRPKKRGEKG